ncbi:hypothetical protein DXG01_000243 [Tephrocybe rancida]|nr:hypothetical protein DXG01_000243 [Tephrocybe rancida]
MTTSLAGLLPQLDTAFKKATKAHRTHQYPRIPKSHAKRPMRPQDYMLPSPTSSFPQPLRVSPAKLKAWYLDVASPTWEDMRTLGKAKTGPHNRAERKDNIEDESVPDAGIVGEANVYLVVFKGGICSFHFTNISEHTDRVRSRIRLLQEAINMSSDWIAHGILDSIVDSFFPLLEEIEREVVAIEGLVLTAGGGAPYPGAQHEPSARLTHDLGERELKSTRTHELHEKGLQPLDLEKHPTASLDVKFSSPQLTTSLAFRRMKRLISKRWRRFWAKDISQLGSAQITLRRMARTRRLVTSLTRLLATKSEVVAQVRKRFLSVNRSEQDDDLDVAMYMGDVQDHILTLQHSLVHYERILSQSHPTYLSQLRTGVAFTKRGTDVSIMYLTCVSLAVLCIQPLIVVTS